MIFDVNSDHGQIRVGQLGVAWYNSQPEDAYGEDPGWFIISWKDTNLEFGSIDQDVPGIYRTRYIDGEVVRLNTYWELR